MTAVPIPELVAESVQAATLTLPPTLGGGPSGFDGFLFNFWDKQGTLPLSQWWSPRRDIDLRRYVRGSVVLSGIINSRVLQLKNLSYTLKASDERAEALIPHYQNLLDTAQSGDGFRALLGLWSLDRHTQDNGGVIELVGEGTVRPYTYTYEGNKIEVVGLGPLGNPSPFDSPAVRQAKAKAAIQGINHLDASACWPTHNTEWPIIYRNTYTGRWFILHRSRVVRIAQMRQASELGRGIGFCATSRAFFAADLVQAAHQYSWEKITGQAAELGIVTGVNRGNLEKVLNGTGTAQDQNGRTFFKGVAFVYADMLAGITPDVKLVGMKAVPDGWDKEKEFDIAMRFIAIAMATDTRDIGWSKGETGATKADAEVQDAKTSGRGRGDEIGDMEWIFNTRILPSGISFAFDAKDDLEDFRRAEIERIRAEVRSIRLMSGELSIVEARELAAREGDLPAEFMQTQTVVRDGENVMTDAQTPTDGGAVPRDTSLTEQQKSINTYTRALLSLVNQYRKGTLDKLTFKRLMRNEIEKQFERAWRDGAARVEANPNEGDSFEELDRLIREELQFVQQFADAVQEAKGAKAITMADIRRRVGMWANRFLEIANRAMIWLGGEKRLKWIHTVPLNAHEYCRDCIALDGRVMTASEWKRRGVYPQDSRLECGGWECDCELVVTSEPVTRAPFPELSFAVG